MIKDNGDPVIAEATKVDLPFIMNLIAACTRDLDSQGIDQWDEIFPDKQKIAHDIEQHSLYVATLKRDCCGMIVINDKQPLEYKDVDWKYGGEKILVIHRLTIHPDWQGQGMAQVLMDFAERLGKERHFASVRLDAFIENPRAVNFYECRGYRKAGIVHFRKGPFFCFERRLEES